PLRHGASVQVRVVGSMGVGKTRMVQEVTGGLSARGVSSTVVSCPPYGQDLPYATLAGLLRALLVRLERVHGAEALGNVLMAAAEHEGLDATLASGIVRELVAGNVEEADTTADIEAARHLPAQLRKGLLARATKVIMRAVSAERPHLLVLDDCHWLDQATEAILREATLDLALASIGWMFVARPDWNVPADWRDTHELRLEALSASDSAQLAT